jgi:signal transduction histidine kinase
MMRSDHPPSCWRRPHWLRLPRPTARLRLTALYSGLFLACGVALLTITYVLFDHAVNEKFVKVSGTQQPGTASSSWIAGFGRIQSSPGPSLLSPPPRLNFALTADAERWINQQQAAELSQLLTQSGIALAIVTVIAVAGGWLVAGRVLRPLAAITATARRISASNLRERVALAGPRDELKALGDTLDELFDRLEASFEAQRHFIANASHELRTPLTADRALLQVTLDDPAATPATWQVVSEELLASNAEQELLIEALLALATSEGGLHDSEPADLAAITDAALLTPRPGISELNLRIEASTRPAPLVGDPILITRLVANLIDNAVRHNVPSGSIQVTAGTRGGHAVLSVVNAGPVIGQDDTGRLFQPFQRLHSRRASDRRGTGGACGHGLGLSIVRAIAAAHGATITALALPGGGLSIEVAFPSAAGHEPGVPRDPCPREIATPPGHAR